MHKVFCYRVPSFNTTHEWAEVENGHPVHPANLYARVWNFFQAGKEFAVSSDISIAIISHLVRSERIKLPCRLVYVDAAGQQKELRMATDGGFIEPWPEEGQESIIDARFHWLYA